MSKIKNKKLPFSFHSLLSFSLYISHYFLLPSLFFSFLLLAFTHAVLQDCTNPHTLGLHFFSSHLHMVEWPHHFFLHLFLLFSLSNSSYQVTINASQLILTLLQPISFLQLSLSRMTLASFFSFILPTCLTSLTSHIHLCDLTFVHPFINVDALLYIITEKKRRKDEPNFSSFGQASPTSSICFADVFPIFQRTQQLEPLGAND